MKQWQAYLTLALLTDILRRQMATEEFKGLLNLAAFVAACAWSCVWLVMAAYHYLKDKK